MKNKYFIHESAYIDQPVHIGEGTKIWHFCHVMKDASIGQNCTLGQNVYIDSGVSIGNNVKIQNNVSIFKKVTLEDDVFCGPSCVFTNVINPRSQYMKTLDEYYETRVKRGATIGANATIVCGITINCYAFVGAGSVVTKDVPDYALVYGNPAVKRGWLTEAGAKLEFPNEESSTTLCSVTNAVYQIESGRVRKCI